ncbi:MAG: oligosaccharide flippase family protein [bacterium]
MKIAKFSLYYLLSSLGSAGLSLFLLPVLTHLIPPGELGIWVILQTTAVYYQLVSTLGMNSVLMEKGFEKDRYGLFSVLIKISIPLHLLLFLIFLAAGLPYLEFLIGAETAEKYKTPLLLIAGGAALERIVMPINTLYQIYERIRTINVLKIIYTILFFTLALFATASSRPVFFLCFAFFTANLVYGILTVTVFFYTPLRLIPGRAAPLAVNPCRIINFVLPVFLGVLFLETLHTADRFMIQLFTDSSYVAAYSVIYKGGIFYLLILNAFREAWYPFVLKKKRENVKESSNIFFAQFFCVNLFILLLLCTILPRIYALKIRGFLLIPEFYHGFFANFPILILAYFFCGLYYFLEVVTLRQGFVWPHTFLKLGCMILNIILNIIWIPAMGLFGAFLSTSICFGMLFIISLFWAPDLMLGLWKNKKYLTIIICQIAIFALLLNVGLFTVK